MPTPLNCPKCSAPLDMAASNIPVARCPYCGNSLVMPDQLREGASGSQVKGSFGSMIDQSLKLAEVARLAQSGSKIQAIKLYRDITGVGLKEAKDAVEHMEAGQPVTIAHTTIQTERDASELLSSIVPPHAQAMQRTFRRMAFWIAASIILIVGITIVIVATKTTGSSPAAPVINMPPLPGQPNTKSANAPAPPAFADVALEFGSEGIGAGQFKDARSVAVDGEGRIYVGEYTGGRIQVFDSEGKFITQWMVDGESALLDLAADRKGIIYVVHTGKILSYEGMTGKLISEVPKLHAGIQQYYTGVFAALDGSLYAITSNSNILRITASGEIKTLVNVSESLGKRISFEKLAVDGTGNIYALSRHESAVFKFAPDGRFANRFGSRGDQPGQFRSVHGVAVDGQGRIYVADSGRAMQVFDGDGRYLDTFGGTELVFGIVINDRNEIFASQRNRHKIVKYALSKQ